MKWDLDIWRSPAPLDSTWLLLTERRAFYLCRRVRVPVKYGTRILPFHLTSEEQWEREREADRRHVLLNHRRIINLRLSIQHDHTANMKFTHCVEHLIKYWLQTYKNLPHQIKPPVGGPPLIRAGVWSGNEAGEAAGMATEYTFRVLLIYLFCYQVVLSQREAELYKTP